MLEKHMSSKATYIAFDDIWQKNQNKRKVAMTFKGRKWQFTRVFKTESLFPDESCGSDMVGEVSSYIMQLFVELTLISEDLERYQNSKWFF